MSETGVGDSSTAQAGVLYDEVGNRIAGGRSEPDDLEPLVRFAREQPLTTALIALGIGYFLGKLL
jgi:hypothetical protein